MARARNIKPRFFQNDELGELDPLSRLLFIGMWTIADFKGCIEYRPKMLKAQLLPYDECNIEVLVTNLEQSRFIQFYSVQGKRYIKIINFEKHQNPHKNEREAGSEIPDITKQDNKNNNLTQDGTKPDLIGTTSEPLALIPSTLIPDSLNPIPDSPKLIPSVTGAEKSAPTPKTEISKSVKPETDLQAACRETWKSYSDAYFLRYETEPVRNATINTQVKAFVKRIGVEEAPHVAAFFVQSNAAFYVQRGHAFGNLLADAEKLRTEWVTGRTMTGTRARQIDQSQANFSVVGEAMKILEAQNARKTS